jgi:hypothetical protein
MTDPAPPPRNEHASFEAGGSLIVQPLPAEAAFPLRKDDFLTLCEGDISEARSNRDVCAGISCTAVVGFFGVLAAIDWDTIWKAGPLKIIVLVILLMFLLITTSGSAVGALIHNSRLKRTLKDSPYSRVKARLLKEYDAQAPSQGKYRTLSHIWRGKQVGHQPMMKVFSGPRLFRI